jgi:hypothetical protein
MGIGKSPLTPLCQRGVIPPLGKGRIGGILQMDVVTILRTLINPKTMSNSKGNDARFVIRFILFVLQA